MPSDLRGAVLAALAPQIRALHASLAAAAEEIRGWLATQDADERTAAVRWQAELGPFAAGRVAGGRLAQLFSTAAKAERGDVAATRRGLDVLDRLVARHEDLVSVRVPPGGDLVAEVDRALAVLGRAFAAARLIERARAGRPPRLEDLRDLDALPFRRWSRAERRAAPPLVVEADGADLVVAGLAPYLDGRQRLVLIVTGAMASAPLARLITPGTFVMQTGDPDDLARLTRWDGPGIAALVPDTAARFVHRPDGGAPSWERLTVSHLPDGPIRALGGISAAQQTEDLRQLAALAERPEPAPAAPAALVAAAESAGAPAGEAVSPADKLAAWLLRQADLGDLG